MSLMKYCDFSKIRVCLSVTKWLLLTESTQNAFSHYKSKTRSRLKCCRQSSLGHKHFLATLGIDNVRSFHVVDLLFFNKLINLSIISSLLSCNMLFVPMSRQLKTHYGPHYKVSEDQRIHATFTSSKLPDT